MYKFLNYCFSMVWIVNGLYCKVLNFVPRHQEIVGRILGTQYAKPMTILIGMSEVVMAIWILSGYKSRMNAITQMVVVATMNVLEFLLVPDLLLWGKFNSLFAAIFIATVYYNEFHLQSNQKN